MEQLEEILQLMHKMRSEMAEMRGDLNKKYYKLNKKYNSLSRRYENLTDLVNFQNLKLTTIQTLSRFQGIRREPELQEYPADNGCFSTSPVIGYAFPEPY